MKKEITVTLSTDEIAEALFDLDNKQVAEVISKWKELFDQEYKRRKAEGETIWIFDLNHFMMYVMKEADENVKEFFRNAYAHYLYTTLKPTSC